MFLTLQQMKYHMFRFTITITLLFSGMVTYAQTKLNGSYAVSNVTYLSGDQLPDGNILKHTYVKYTFHDPDQINISSTYYEKGREYSYDVHGNLLNIKSEAGSIMNTMKILEHSENKLVLISASANNDLEDPWAIKYTFYKEELMQKNMPLSPDDIFSIKGTDTTYKSGQKIYAQFNGSSFQSYIYERIRKKHMEVKSGELISTFIVDANGKADSLRIIKGINPTYDSAYIKAFLTAKSMWQPAYFNGKTVKVLMNQRLQYLTSEQTLPAYFDTRKADAAYNAQDYPLALYYYDKAIETKGDDTDNLYRRGICKQMLGNLKGACADWLKIQSLGKNTADDLLRKYCQ